MKQVIYSHTCMCTYLCTCLGIWGRFFLANNKWMRKYHFPGSPYSGCCPQLEQSTVFFSLHNLLQLKEKCIFSQFSRTKSLIYDYKVKDFMKFFTDLHQSFPTVISILGNIKQHDILRFYQTNLTFVPLLLYWPSSSSPVGALPWYSISHFLSPVSTFPHQHVLPLYFPGFSSFEIGFLDSPVFVYSEQ